MEEEGRAEEKGKEEEEQEPSSVSMIASLC